MDRPFDADVPHASIDPILRQIRAGITDQMDGYWPATLAAPCCGHAVAPRKDCKLRLGAIADQIGLDGETRDSLGFSGTKLCVGCLATVGSGDRSRDVVSHAAFHRYELIQVASHPSPNDLANAASIGPSLPLCEATQAPQRVG